MKEDRRERIQSETNYSIEDIKMKLRFLSQVKFYVLDRLLFRSAHSVLEKNFFHWKHRHMKINSEKMKSKNEIQSEIKMELERFVFAWIFISAAFPMLMLTVDKTTNLLVDCNLYRMKVSPKQKTQSQMENNGSSTITIFLALQYHYML